MKGNRRRLMALSAQLKRKAAAGVKTVNWKLTKEEYEFLKELGYEINVSLYQIQTRRFPNICKLPPIIKEVHYKAKAGKGSFGRHLNEGEKQILNEHGVNYTPLRYEIKLNRMKAEAAA